jgi:hypothetical protein
LRDVDNARAWHPARIPLATSATQVASTHPGTPAGKLANVELHFTAGALVDIKLLGFSVW